MARWRLRISPAVEAQLLSMGPYTIEQSGYLAWFSAPDFEWPGGRAALSFQVDYRNARDADFLRLMHAWRQVCDRRDEVVAMLRVAIKRGWEWSRENVPAEILAENLGKWEESDDSIPLLHVGACGFSLGTFGAGQVSMTVHVKVGWDDEHGLKVDLVEQERRSSWSFL